MSEYKLKLNAELLPAMAGPQDANFRRIGKSVRSKVTVRGGELIVDGPPEERAPLEKLFRDLEEMARRGRIDETLVETALSLAGFALNGGAGNGSGDGLLVYERSGFTVRTRSRNQDEYMRATNEADIVFCIGPAGTGKTYLAVAVAVRALIKEEVDRIILVRPAVEAGERLGFLPGDLKEKVDPYFRPLYDALMDMLTPEKLRRFTEQGRIEVAPLAYMRGRTLNNAFVILDEAQNTTSSQLKMFLTRLGARSKAIVTGDLTQIDLDDPSSSGLSEAVVILRDIRGIRFVTLDHTDVVRHQLVKEIVQAYERERGSAKRDRE